MMPSATLSATALATACWAGPNICTACFAPLIVTLLNITVAGLQSRFGATTASSDVNPSLLLVKALANADFGCASARAHDEIDVGDFVAFADKRFTDAESVDLCHRHLPPRKN